jgi:hypothetical protein
MAYVLAQDWSRNDVCRVRNLVVVLENINGDEE